MSKIFKLLIPLVASLVSGSFVPSSSSRIFGGVEVDPKFRYPFIVSLQSENKHYCGGTLVYGNYVITAAHCNKQSFDEVKWVARVHRHDLAQEDITESGITYNVISIQNHPDYNPMTDHNDISVWKLDAPASKDMGIKLDDGKLLAKVGKPLKVIGWGLVDEYKENTILQEVILPLMSDEVCASLIQGLELDSHFCGGYLEGKKDACQGDSGGPVLGYKNQEFYLVGIVSWGYGCGNKNSPGAYTRVNKFSEFISSNIKVNEDLLQIGNNSTNATLPSNPEKNDNTTITKDSNNSTNVTMPGNPEKNDNTTIIKDSNNSTNVTMPGNPEKNDNTTIIKDSDNSTNVTIPGIPENNNNATHSRDSNNTNLNKSDFPNNGSNNTSVSEKLNNLTVINGNTTIPNYTNNSSHSDKNDTVPRYHTNEGLNTTFPLYPINNTKNNSNTAVLNYSATSNESISTTAPNYPTNNNSDNGKDTVPNYLKNSTNNDLDVAVTVHSNNSTNYKDGTTTSEHPSSTIVPKEHTGSENPNNTTFDYPINRPNGDEKVNTAMPEHFSNSSNINTNSSRVMYPTNSTRNNVNITVPEYLSNSSNSDSNATIPKYPTSIIDNDNTPHKYALNTTKEATTPSSPTKKLPKKCHKHF